jgi:hypothetical protein
MHALGRGNWLAGRGLQNLVEVAIEGLSPEADAQVTLSQ